MNRLAAVVAALTAVASGCGVGESGSGLSDDGKGNRASAADTLDWTLCHGDLLCTTLEVPLDHADPAGETITISIARRPAASRADRVGALFVNPGGPGASAIELLQFLALPGEIADRFDIVAVEPRGLEGSTSLDCHDTLQELYAADPSIEDEGDRTRLLDVSRTFVDTCAERAGRLLPFVGTRQVARDMDAVRVAMGDDQLSYLGYSYGTVVGQVYLDLFPRQVRAMVLDGVVDLALTGIDAATQQAEGFEAALGAFAADCDRRGDTCPLAPDTMAKVDTVFRDAETGIDARGADRDLGPGELTLGVTQALYSEVQWSALALAINDALEGDGTALVDLADAYLHREGSDGPYADGFELYFAVNCLDSAWPSDTDAFFDAGAAAERRAPHLGEPTVLDYIRCALWPVAPEPLEPTTAPGAPPVVVVSTTGDPATPHENGVATAERLAGAVLITNEGNEHGVSFFGIDCVDDPVTAYLVDLTLPAGGLVCESS